MALPQDDESQLADQFCFEKIFPEFAERQGRMLEEMMSLLVALNAKFDVPANSHDRRHNFIKEAMPGAQCFTTFANDAEDASPSLRVGSQLEVSRPLEKKESGLLGHFSHSLGMSNDLTKAVPELRVGHSISAKLDAEIKALDNTKRQRHVERFRRLMDLDNEVEDIEPKHIALALTKKAPARFTARLYEDDLKCLLSEFAELIDIEHATQNQITLDAFVDLMVLPNLPSMLDGLYSSQAEAIQRYLMREDAYDFIATKFHPAVSDGERSPHIDTPILDQLVVCSVILSLIVLGTSSDVAPDAFFWIVIEGVIGLILFIEIVVKISLLGWRDYFVGPEWRTHNLDVIITCIAVLDIAISLVVYGTQTSDDISTGRLAMVARILRLARAVRLLKALKMPFAMELAHILSGFIVALPTLWSILLLLFSYVYFVGVMFRMFVGPEAGQDLMSVCPNGDDVTTAGDEQCKIHWLYGEEYFGTTLGAMFTIFRCTIGDCASRGGRSLTANLSDGFGIRFDVVYCAGMTLIIFGLFNIINAIFVESVLAGLKHKELRNKYEGFFDPTFVNNALTELTERLHSLNVNCELITETDYADIIKDHAVARICDVLDVSLYDLEGKFDVFDTNGNGYINASQFLKTIMMLRGETQKSDVVSSLVVVRGLRDRVEELQRVVLANQQNMMQYQRQLLSGSTSSLVGGSELITGEQANLGSILTPNTQGRWRKRMIRSDTSAEAPTRIRL